MSSLQQPSLFISFTNNAQRAQLLPPGGFPQSLSGSETDISTSNENLSHEERYVIRHTARQEPQGQENLSSNRSSLDVSTSSYNTLIIHGAGDEPWTGRLSGIRDFQETGPASPSYLAYSSGDNAKMGSHSPSPGTTKEASNRKSYDASSNRLFDPNGRDITDIPDDYLSQSQVLKHLAKEAKVAPTSSSPGPSNRDSCPPRERSESANAGYLPNPSLSDHRKRLSLSAPPCNESALSQDLAPPPPPQYPKWEAARLTGDKMTMSRSQPDLSRVGARRAAAARGTATSTSPRPTTNGREDLDAAGHEIWPPAEMVEILIQENSALKLELETCYQKVAKSQKLEHEIGKIHRAHEEMVSSSERRERLERAARGRLQSDCRRLQDMNRALRDQADAFAAQLRMMPAQPEPDGLRKELTKRELLIAQLITQNKELVAARDRQEIELAAQRATLQEQRTHIDILDTALTNAQGNVVRLEEECRKKQMCVERVAQLQRALASLQLTSDRREQTERKLRLQLERELRSERARGSSAGDASALSESAPELKRQLREREEKIMRLEGEVAKWEQRYLEESALRQAAIDAASIPKDAKIAALEKSSQETEKLIAEARVEKIRHMDEVHDSQKKVTDLECRLKEQESKLAERDAMIRVLQKHTYDKDMSSAASSSSYLGRSPHHTPHPSLHTNSDLGTVLGSREELDPVSTTSVFSNVSSVLTSSYTGSDSYTTLSRAKYSANKSFDDTKKSLDDQLKELDSQLDSQLLSKRALCCFPGFSNSSAASRKGKVPKPLLAGVGGGFEAGFLQGLVAPRYEQARPEEMLLLEKQGRCSQQQRMQESCLGARVRAGSLPPTSLPRPHRARPAGVKLAAYGRLSDGEGRKKTLEEMADPGKGDESQCPPRRPLPDFTRFGAGAGGKKADAVQIRAKPAAPARRLGEYGRLSDGDGRKMGEGAVRSRIPSPMKLGEYGRLSDGSMEKPGSRAGSSIKSGGRDSSNEDLGSQSKLLPRARSLNRDASKGGKAEDAQSSSSAGKYRIQF